MVRVLVVGDSYCPSAALEPAFADVGRAHEVSYANVIDAPDWRPSTASELALREYLGTPDQVIELLDGQDVLVVQGAPVSDAVLDASRGLQLVGVARGGPVNVDVAAATSRGIPIVLAPGKNAVSVAEITVAFAIMLARRIPEAMRYVDGDGDFGHDNYEGARWFGHEVEGRTLGLIGFGQVGRQVAKRASALGMRVVAFDPFVERVVIAEAGAVPLELDALLASSDIVSLHARATAENRRLMDASRFELMKPGAAFINTSRETLVDEAALAQALRSGRLSGAALDVASPPPSGARHPLLDFPNVIIVPHVAGATSEALTRAGRMLADEIGRLARGQAFRNLANPEVLERAAASAE
jgi:D-3-phosphoglycerate dehydrogenase